MKEVRIYLSEQPHPNIGKWEIYKDGVATGELVGNDMIRKLLNDAQYKKFLNGDDIFVIPANTYRTRNHNTKPKGFHGKRIEFNNFDDYE